MGEEIHSSVSGGNGERLEVRVGTKAFGLAAKDLLPILLLLSGLVGGYLIYMGLNERLQGLQAAQEHIIAGLRDNQLKILERLRDQDGKLLQALREQDESLHAKSEWVRQLLVIHDLNVTRAPNERLPLDLPMSRVPHQEPPR